MSNLNQLSGRFGALSINKKRDREFECNECRLKHTSCIDFKENYDTFQRYQFTYKNLQSYVGLFLHYLELESSQGLKHSWPIILCGYDGYSYPNSIGPNLQINFKETPSHDGPVLKRDKIALNFLTKSSNSMQEVVEVFKLRKAVEIIEFPPKADADRIKFVRRTKNSLICEVTQIGPSNLDGRCTIYLKISGYSEIVLSPNVHLVPYKRAECALLALLTQPDSAIIQQVLDPKKTTSLLQNHQSLGPANTQNSLNEKQKLAVLTALNQPLTLIQGPPGTGKTAVSAHIAMQAVRHRYPSEKVLISGTSNEAVDNVCLRIAQLFPEVRLIRMLSRTKEKDNEWKGKKELKPYYLHEKVKRALPFSVSAGQYLTNEQMRVRYRIQDSILADAEVICATCATSGDGRLKKIMFSLVLVDEATQSPEPVTLIPFALASRCLVRHLVLVGDNCQLGPCVELNDLPYKISLFERLVVINFPKVMLQVQYRMEERIARFSSECFYEGLLESSKRRAPMPTSEHARWGNNVVKFVHLQFAEGNYEGNCSFINRQEAFHVLDIVRRCLSRGMKADQIGVVTPYSAQRSMLRGILAYTSTEGMPAVEVNSVDGFQGREKDYIIFSCVRSNANGKIGFLSDPRRLNVALTRAKYGLLLVGNVATLQDSRSSVWMALISHCNKEGYIVPARKLDHFGGFKFDPISLLPQELRDRLHAMMIGQNSHLIDEPSPPSYSEVTPPSYQEVVYASRVQPTAPQWHPPKDPPSLTTKQPQELPFQRTEVYTPNRNLVSLNANVTSPASRLSSPIRRDPGYPYGTEQMARLRKPLDQDKSQKKKDESDKCALL